MSLMIGCEEAIAWAEGLSVDEVDVQERVISRMRYEFEKSIGATVKMHKGRYANRYTCGNCGAGISEPYWKYCPNCGYGIIRKEGP